MAQLNCHHEPQWKTLEKIVLMFFQQRKANKLFLGLPVCDTIKFCFSTRTRFNLFFPLLLRQRCFHFPTHPDLIADALKTQTFLAGWVTFKEAWRNFVVSCGAHIIWSFLKQRMIRANQQHHSVFANKRISTCTAKAKVVLACWQKNQMMFAEKHRGNELQNKAWVSTRGWPSGDWSLESQAHQEDSEVFHSPLQRKTQQEETSRDSNPELTLQNLQLGIMHTHLDWNFLKHVLWMHIINLSIQSNCNQQCRQWQVLQNDQKTENNGWGKWLLKHFAAAKFAKQNKDLLKVWFNHSWGMKHKMVPTEWTAKIHFEKWHTVKVSVQEWQSAMRSHTWTKKGTKKPQNQTENWRMPMTVMTIQQPTSQFEF